ncbi:hypothetical protein DCAR_0727789 [Daucus carota subsp. sativus]|uniref:No apical meristem-associated C-terminal domain-containing protein n=1 Tax=Daucus carota subsp. sativus TaxID=79200 RepID=A0AAF0XID5_DAUCS|nr:hypothetical protein DCAR_0727789 [Daucus carota subsp. sativus]
MSSSARGKSFSSKKDEAICRAFLSITEDLIIGNSQSCSHFWTRVFCNKFRDCLRSVQELHQNGITHQNEYDLAKQMYFDDTGKYFLWNGWFKVEVHEEAEIPKTYESPEAEITPSSGGSDSVFSPRKRPLGTKLAKRNKAKSKVEEIHNARHLDLLETNYTCEEKETQRKDLEMEERIMGMDMSTIQDPEMKAYYQHKRASILAK